MEGNGTVTVLDPLTRKLVTYDMHTGEEIAKEGCLVPKSNFQYTVELAAGICSLIERGYTPLAISKMEDLPNLSLINAWKRAHPDFRKAMDEAKVDRAEFFHDRAVAEVDLVEEKDDVVVGKFKFDSYMKLAEKNDPEKYGNQTKITGSGGPLQIIVNTGIVRPDPIIVENTHEEQDSTYISGRSDDGVDAGAVREEVLGDSGEEGGIEAGRTYTDQEANS